MSLNNYAWVEGNPVMNTDPSGMFNWQTGIIEQGDWLWCIAREGTSGWNGNNPPPHEAVNQTLRLILAVNGIPNDQISDPDIIYPGLHLSMPAHIQQTGLLNADKSCHPERVSESTPPPPPSPPPPRFNYWDFLLDICIPNLLDSLRQGVEDFCDIPIRGSTSETMKNFIREEIQQIYGEGTINPLEVPVQNFANTKQNCQCDSVSLLLASPMDAAVDEFFSILAGDVMGTGAIGDGPMSRMNMISPETAANLMAVNLHRGQCPPSFVSQDRYALAYMIASTPDIENLILDVQTPARENSDLNCGVVFQVRYKLYQGIEASNILFDKFRENGCL